MAERLGQDVRTVSGLTLVSRIFGLARDLATARIFADTVVGSAFAAAFAIPNMFRRLFGEGALSAAFLPEYTRLSGDDPELAGAFARRTLAMLALFTGALTIVVELGLWGLLLTLPDDPDRDLSLRLVMISMPFMPLVCVAAIFGGMLQAHGRFGVWASAPIILNVCVIGACAPYWLLEMDDARRWAHPIAASVVLSGLIQIAWSAHALRGMVRWGSSADAARKVRAMLIRMGPAIIGLGTLQFNALVDTTLAMWPVWVGPEMFGRATPLDEASNAILYYAQRLYQFPLGVFGIAVATAAFPALSRAAGDPEAFLAVLRRGIRLALFIALPASVGLALVREDLVRSLYTGMGGGFSDDGVIRAGSVTLAYGVAVWSYSLNHVLTRGFYARGDTTTPMRLALVALGTNVALSMALIWRFQESGLAWGTAGASVIQSGLLLAMSGRGTLDRTSLVGIGRSIALTALMGAAVWGTIQATRHWGASQGQQEWLGGVLRLGVAVAAGGIVYTTLAALARAPELGWLMARTTGTHSEGDTT